MESLLDIADSIILGGEGLFSRMRCPTRDAQKVFSDGGEYFLREGHLSRDDDCEFVNCPLYLHCTNREGYL